MLRHDDERLWNYLSFTREKNINAILSLNWRKYKKEVLLIFLFLTFLKSDGVVRSFKRC